MKPVRLSNRDDIRQGHIRRPRALRIWVRSRKSAVSFVLGQLHPDRGGAGAGGEGRGLDPAQPVAQVAAQRVDGEPEGLPARRERQDQFLLVRRRESPPRGDVAELCEFRLQVLRRGLQRIGIGAGELDVEVVAPGARAPGSEAERFRPAGAGPPRPAVRPRRRSWNRGAGRRRSVRWRWRRAGRRPLVSEPAIARPELPPISARA